jgi:hypothetical protein
VHDINKNLDAILVAIHEIGLDVIADKTNYMVRSRNHNAGRSSKIKFDNSSFESLEHSNIWEQL